MKILTIVYSIGLGGTERAAVNYAIGYKRAGEESRVLVLGRGYDRLEVLIGEGVQVDLLENAHNKEKTFIDIRTWKPDIIHIHNFRNALIPFIEKVRHTHTKIVETNVFSRPNFSRSYQILSLSMQLSKWGCWKYQQWMRLNTASPQTAVVPYPILSDSFQVKDRKLFLSFRNKNKIPQNGFLVGRIGQPHPSKWDIRIIYVIDEVLRKTKDIYFVLVGLPRNIEISLNDKMGRNHPHIKILPVIKTDAELAQFYGSLDCFAHISKIGESFGYVLAEAMLFNVPVVTMLTPLRDNAQFEMIRHDFGGKCAINTKQFVQYLLEIYNDKTLYNRIRQNLIGSVEERFGLSSIVKIQLPLYHKLLQDDVIHKEDYSQLINNVFRLYGIKRYILKLIFYLIHNPLLKFNYSRLLSIVNKANV